MNRRKIALFVLPALLVVLILLGVMTTLGLGSGGCVGEYEVVDFEFAEVEHSSGEYVQIQHDGGDTIEANATFIVTERRNYTWATLQPPQADNRIEAGENVSVTTSGTETVTVIHQRAPPSRSQFNPLTADPCYTDRNQTLGTYNVSARAAISDTPLLGTA